MWRATVMALGLCMVLLGGEAMILDRVVLADERTDMVQNNPYSVRPATYPGYERFNTFNAGFSLGDRRTFIPPDWAPWGLLSAGALTFLYATAIPGGRVSED